MRRFQLVDNFLHSPFYVLSLKLFIVITILLFLSVLACLLRDIKIIVIVLAYYMMIIFSEENEREKHEK